MGILNLFRKKREIYTAFIQKIEYISKIEEQIKVEEMTLRNAASKYRDEKFITYHEGRLSILYEVLIRIKH